MDKKQEELRIDNMFKLKKKSNRGDSIMFEKEFIDAIQMTESPSGEDFYTEDGVLKKYFGQNAIVEIPNGIKRIGSGAFHANPNLLRVILSEGVEELGMFAFFGCTNLCSITLSSTLKTIEFDAFSHCDSLVEVINHSPLKIIPGDESSPLAYNALTVHKGECQVDFQGNYIFYKHNGKNYMLGYTGNERKVVLPENYNGESYEIYKFAFANCNFEDMVFSNGVIGIGTEVFQGCENLNTLTIPDTLTQIDEFFLIECPNDITVYTTKNSPIHKYSRTNSGKLFDIKIEFIE